MINIVSTVITTSVIVAGVIVTIMKGFFKTNTEALKDHERIEERFDKKIEKLEIKFNNANTNNTKFWKEELDKLADKIDAMKHEYVTNENFKTYVDSINQLLKMSTDRMSRIETTLDDIRYDIGSIAKGNNQYAPHNTQDYNI